MTNLIVVYNPKRWPLEIPSVPVVAAHAYLTDPRYSRLRNVRVFNLCRSYRYQSNGYYVSLLAMARGHKPIPSITAIQDMKSVSIARIVADGMDDLIQRTLRPIKSGRFVLSVYFGRNMARRYEELSTRLFRIFQAPLLRAEFERREGEWYLEGIRHIAANDIPESHQPFVVDCASRFFSNTRLPAQRRSRAQYDLAILHNPEELTPPSNAGAIRRFVAAGKRLRLDVELIEREDFGQIAEFDALFIRETTSVHHHTYRFARRAAAEGLVVIDDPDSIAKCTNKVYLAELLTRYSIPTPRTLVVHRDNREAVAREIGLPCILKQPDSSFSQGVLKAETEAALHEILEKLFEKSDLVIAQEFLPTEFDWRIGLLDRKVLYACKYFMVKKHWQIARTEENRTHYGDVEAVALEQVPRSVLKTAVRAARLIGDGLYGVDVKQVGGSVRVIEINDNPSIDAGQEDRIAGGVLYERIMQSFLTRIQRKKDGLVRVRA